MSIFLHTRSSNSKKCGMRQTYKNVLGHYVHGDPVYRQAIDALRQSSRIDTLVPLALSRRVLEFLQFPPKPAVTEIVLSSGVPREAPTQIPRARTNGGSIVYTQSVSRWSAKARPFVTGVIIVVTCWQSIVDWKRGCLFPSTFLDIGSRMSELNLDASCVILAASIVM